MSCRSIAVALKHKCYNVTMESPTASSLGEEQREEIVGLNTKVLFWRKILELLLQSRYAAPSIWTTCRVTSL